MINSISRGDAYMRQRFIIILIAAPSHWSIVIRTLMDKNKGHFNQNTIILIHENIVENTVRNLKHF